MTITRKDLGKSYILDGNSLNIVRLVEILPDNWAKIDIGSEKYINVTLSRLSDRPATSELSVTDLLDYPMKATKVTIEVSSEAGNFTKTLEGRDAVIWNNWVRELCFRASEVGMNPPWLSLEWKISTVDKT